MNELYLTLKEKKDQNIEMVTYSPISTIVTGLIKKNKIYVIKSHYPSLGLRSLKIGQRVTFVYGLDMLYTLEFFFASFSSHFFVSSSIHFLSFALAIFLQHIWASLTDLGPQKSKSWEVGWHKLPLYASLLIRLQRKNPVPKW